MQYKNNCTIFYVIIKWSGCTKNGMSLSTWVFLSYVGLVYHELAHSVSISKDLISFMEAREQNTLFSCTISSWAWSCNPVLPNEKSEVCEELYACLHIKSKPERSFCPFHPIPVWRLDTVLQPADRGHEEALKMAEQKNRKNLFTDSILVPWY